MTNVTNDANSSSKLQSVIDLERKHKFNYKICNLIN